MTRNTARTVTVCALILLIASIWLIYQYGIPAIFAREVRAQGSDQASLPATASTQVALILTPTHAPTETTTVTPTLAPAQPADPEALAIMINDKRQTAGYTPLALNDQLSQAAQKVSDGLVKGQTPTENQIGQTLRQAGYYYTAFWTNSTSTNRRGTLNPVDEWLFNAQSQQVWLSNDYPDLGIASATDSAGKRYYVILFAKPLMLTAPGAEVSNAGLPTQAGQAQAILTLLNAVRLSTGLKPLSLNSKLTAAAGTHSQDQAYRDKMTHDGSDGSQVTDRTTAAGYAWSAVGENVLQRPDLHAAGAFDQWWNSQVHRENMMNPQFTEIGIAYAKSALGNYYYTMVLGAPS